MPRFELTSAIRVNAHVDFGGQIDDIALTAVFLASSDSIALRNGLEVIET